LGGERIRVFPNTPRERNIQGNRAGMKYDQLSDQQLLQKYKESRNTFLLGLLYRRYYPKVLGACLNLLKNEPDAQDATSDIFDKLCKRLHEFEIQSFNAWLYRLTKNHCLKVLQNRWKTCREDIENIHPDFFVESSEEGDQYYDDKIESISDAVDSLGEDQKQCIIMHYFENRSYKEIEESTAYTYQEVKSHLQNGRRNLRNLVTKLA